VFDCTYYNGVRYTNPVGTVWNVSPNLAKQVNVFGGLNIAGVTYGTGSVDAHFDLFGYGRIYARPVPVSIRQSFVNNIVVAPSSWEILVGGTQQLSATAYDQYGDVMPGIPFTWASSYPAAATVSSTGLVTGQAAGGSTITASSSGKQASAFGIVRAFQPAVTVSGWSDVRPGPNCVLRYMPHLQDTEAVSYTWTTSGTIVSDYGMGGVDVYFTKYNVNWVTVTIDDGNGNLIEGTLHVDVTDSGTECTGYPPYGL